jgi:hypothetical protein
LYILANMSYRINRSGSDETYVARSDSFHVGFRILRSHAFFRITVSYDTTPCSRVDIYERLGGSCWAASIAFSVNMLHYTYYDGFPL